MLEADVSNEKEELIRRADEFAVRGDWGPAAEEGNRRLIELDPKRVIAYTRLAKCLREKGDSEPAEALYRRVLELEPGNRIASNYLAGLKAEGEGRPRVDIDELAAARARARTGVVRDVTDSELVLLMEAARAVPRASGEYQQNDYITNILLTVLDLQMHNVAVNNSITYYWKHRWDEIRTLEDLAEALDRFPVDQEGNRQVAQYLWGNNHWKRVEWLRGFLPFLMESGLTDYDSLKKWAHASDFRRDFEGRVKYLGIAAYKWLTMRLGVDTVKPDVQIRNFVEPIVGHPVSDEELVRVIEQVAPGLGMTPRELDASIWEYQRGGPGAV